MTRRDPQDETARAIRNLPEAMVLPQAAGKLSIIPGLSVAAAKDILKTALAEKNGTAMLKGM